MIEDLADVPPCVHLLVAEAANCASRADLRKKIRGLLPDLRVQSEAYLLSAYAHQVERQNPLKFNIHLHGALDVLGGDGCQNIKCRLAAAQRLARSVGLIADTVWITDFLSEKFVHFGRSTNAKIDRIIEDLVVVFELLPLIRAGIIRFRSPPVRTCFDCAKKFNSHLVVTRDALYQQFRSDFKIREFDNKEFAVDLGHCITPTLIFRGSFDAALPTKAEFARRWIEDEIQSISWVAREASICQGAIFSNSRVGLASLAFSEGRSPDRRTLMTLDEQRSFDIPWVSELSASQIVELRQEAGRALPSFREVLAKSLSTEMKDSSPLEQIHELRELAAEARAELDAKRSSSARFWKVTYGLLGLGLSAYGVSSDQLIPGVGGLLPVLQLLIGHKAGFEADMTKLETRPGYVLVKAQDLLAHSH